MGRVKRRHRKTFFVPHWGKPTGSGLHNHAKAHRYAGRHPGTMLTRPETTRRFPQEAAAVEEEAQTPEGLFRAGVAALLARASSQEIGVCLPPPPPPPCGLPRSAPISLSATYGRTFKIESSISRTTRSRPNCQRFKKKFENSNLTRFSLPCLSLFSGDRHPHKRLACGGRSCRVPGGTRRHRGCGQHRRPLPPSSESLDRGPPSLALALGWQQGRELSGLWATSARPPQPCLPLEEVGKTSTPAGKAALAPAAVKVVESPPPAPLAQLKFESDDEG